MFSSEGLYSAEISLKDGPIIFLPTRWQEKQSEFPILASPVSATLFCSTISSTCSSSTIGSETGRVGSAVFTSTGDYIGTADLIFICNIHNDSWLSELFICLYLFQIFAKA